MHTFTLIDQVTDLINALPDPPGEEGPGWNSASDSRVSISRVTLMLTSSPKKR